MNWVLRASRCAPPRGWRFRRRCMNSPPPSGRAGPSSRSPCISTTREGWAWAMCWPPSMRAPDRFDSTLGGLGGCPCTPGASGNVCTEEVVHGLALMGFDTGVDPDPPDRRCPAPARGLLGHDVPSQIIKAGGRLDLHPICPPISRSSGLQALARQAGTAARARPAIERPSAPPAAAGPRQRGTSCPLCRAAVFSVLQAGRTSSPGTRRPRGASLRGPDQIASRRRRRTSLEIRPVFTTMPLSSASLTRQMRRWLSVKM